MNWPPNNGAIPRTERVITLQPGQTIGRYGNIGPNSNFVTRPGANPNTLSLPPGTSPNVYQQFRVVKPIPQTTQSTIAPWGGSPGGGTQFQLPKPITQLIREGYIVPY